MLRASNVSFAYGDGPPVLRGVDLMVQRGGLVGILGPNGSGKSTLLRLLAGLLSPRGGRVTLDGVDVANLRRIRLARRLAVVPQETHLAFDYSVLEIVLMGRYPHLGAFEVEGPDDVAIARTALATTGTADLADRAFTTLSGGEKQRVIIASALAQLGVRGERAGSDDGRDDDGPLLLLDEPTASLDLGYQLEIASILRELSTARRLTIVVSTHDLNLAAGLCRELVLLKDGGVLAAGATESVLEPGAIAALYDTEVDVRYHAQAGHLTVVPIRKRTDR